MRMPVSSIRQYNQERKVLGTTKDYKETTQECDTPFYIAPTWKESRMLDRSGEIA